jgi:hypothetical protein
VLWGRTQSPVGIARSRSSSAAPELTPRGRCGDCSRRSRTASTRPRRVARGPSELLDEWLAHKAAADRSPTTIARYRSVIEWQLKPALGAVALDRLETKAFDDRYRPFAAQLEPATIRQAHAVARAALDRAVRWGGSAESGDHCRAATGAHSPRPSARPRGCPAADRGRRTRRPALRCLPAARCRHLRAPGKSDG